MRLLTTASTALLAMAVSAAAPAHAQEVYDFDIARADLVTVVTAIARASGTAVSFPAGLGRGRMAGPIHTRGSAQAALSSALAGSGLEAVPLPGGGLTIQAATVGTDATAVDGDVEAIDVTDVSGGQNNDQGFKPGDAGSSVRIGGAPLKEVPISVSAVTEDVIESQSLTSATDAVRNVAGVTLMGSADTGRPSYNIRGFRTSDNGYTVNGQQPAFGVTTPIDSVERVEVLKGPTSILTGVTSNGGLVNMVLKKPTEETIRDLTMRYGTSNRKSLALDMGGIVPGTEDFTYRFVTSGLHTDETEAGYNDPYELLFFPSVQWTGEDLTLSASLNYVKNRVVKSGPYAVRLRGEDPITELLFDEVVRVPGGGFGNPDFHDIGESLTFNTEQSYDAGILFGGIQVTFDNTFEYTKGSVTSYKFSLFPNSDDPGSSIYGYNTSYDETDSDILTYRPSMTLSYEGDWTSKLKLGYDYKKWSSNGGSIYGPSGTIDISTGLPTIPVFEGEPNEFTTMGDSSKGFYAVEKLDLLDDRLHLLGSFRYDWFTNDYAVGPYVIVDTETKGPSYVLGAAWDITDDLTAFVNHSDGFSPQGRVDNRPVSPEGRTLNEVGLRYAMLDDRFSVTATLYDLTQTNITLFDYDTDPVTFIPSKGQRTRGLELEAQGELLPGWNIIASASTLNSVLLDEMSVVDPSSGNPKYQGSVWTTYTLQEDTLLEGVTLGVGMRAVSSSKANGRDGYYFNIDGYMVADAMVGYERGAFSANLKVNNIFDRDAIQPSRTSSHMDLEPRRNWMLTAKYKF